MNWRLKELLHRPICWIKGHVPSSRRAEMTRHIQFYCIHCGKILSMTTEAEVADNIIKDATWKPVEPTRQAAQDVMTRTIELLEEEEREKWLPKPTARRRTRDRTRPPPAERHRGAISKAMKGKGRQSKYYRQSIKKSPHVRIEDED